MHILVLCTEAVAINTVFTFASAKLHCFEIKLFFAYRDLNFGNMLSAVRWIQTLCLLCDKAKLIPKRLTFSTECTDYYFRNYY